AHADVQREPVADAPVVADVAALIVDVVLALERRVVEEHFDRRSAREVQAVVLSRTAASFGARFLRALVPLACERSTELQLLVAEARRGEVVGVIGVVLPPLAPTAGRRGVIARSDRV